jgi:Fe-S-cluster-containing hydrogenase component 2
VTHSQNGAAGEIVVAHSSAGNYVDPISSMAYGATRAVAARTTVATEILSLDMAIFTRELRSDATLAHQLQSQRAALLEKYAHLRSRPHASDILSFLMAHGVGEATNMLVIDDSLCIGCDQCETACASTHQGVARLKRREGPALNGLHLPISCRHCEHPHCMSDCPADAIHRRPDGEVTISDACIGCDNCEENCPYGAIEMAEIAPARSIADRLLRRPAPEAAKLALKCDQCSGAAAGPACVNACPTGAAIRIGADAVIRLAERRANRKSAA